MCIMIVFIRNKKYY